MFKCIIQTFHKKKTFDNFFKIYNKVWDLVDHSCLAAMRPKAHKINGELQACAYNPTAKSILVCTDKISLLSLKIK